MVRLLSDNAVLESLNPFHPATSQALEGYMQRNGAYMQATGVLDMKPTDAKNLAASLSSEFQVVRGDTFFQMLRATQTKS